MVSVTGGASTDPTSVGDDPGTTARAFDLVRWVRENAAAATSAQNTGYISSEGVRIDIVYRGATDGTTLDLLYGSSKQGNAHIIVVPSGTFIQADAKFWKAAGAPESIQKSGDSFVRPSGSDSLFTDNTTPDSFVEKTYGSITASDLASEVGEETVNGIDCWVVTGRGGKEGGAGYISKDELELVRFVGSRAAPTQLDFSSWNEKFDVVAPSADKIKNLG